MIAQPRLFAAFDRIRIINLHHRTDRRAEMTRELRKVALEADPRVAFFPAIAPVDTGPFASKGYHGSFRSHLALLEEAASAGESILILEDDCDFLLQAITEYPPLDNWDIFYGGYEASEPGNPEQSDIIGAHFMGFSARAAPIAADYLRDFLTPDFVPDARAAMQPGFNPAIRPPIDGAYVWLRRAHPELVTVFAFLGMQRPSRTDIGVTRWFDRIPVVRDVAEYLRRVRRRIVGTPTGMKRANVRFGNEVK
jgi:glycosyl transferase family 25